MKRKKLSVNQLKKLKKLVNQFPVFKISNNETLFCEYCNSEITILKKYNLEQHLKTRFHLENLNSSKKQTALNFVIEKELPNSIEHQLLDALIDSNCPFNIFNNKKFSDFFLNNFNWRIKEESYFRKYLIDDLYNKRLEIVKNIFKEKNFGVYIDETLDSRMRRIMNVFAIPLTGKIEKKSLINTRILNNNTGEEISKIVIESIEILSLNNTIGDLLVLVTDSAKNMKSAFESIKKNSSKMYSYWMHIPLY